MMTTTNHLSVPRIALAFAGSILGAGYLSGQELMQFFGAFGAKGLLGLFLSMGLLAVLAGMAMLLAKRTGLIELDRIIIPWEMPLLRRSVAILEAVFLLATVVIMYAGVGALLQQLLNLPPWIGSLLMCVLATVIAMYGLDGTIRFFSLLVPPTVVITVVFGLLAMLILGAPVIPEPDAGNPLLGSFLPSAISFTSYNFFGIIGLLAPIGTLSRSEKTPFRAAALGAGLLLAIALSVLGAMFACPESCEASLPMLVVAAKLHPLLQYPYALVLFGGMFGSALYGLVTVTTLLEAKSPAFPRYKGRFLVLLALVSYPASLFGFGDLISVLYPLIGYCSIAFILCMVFHYFKASKAAPN